MPFTDLSSVELELVTSYVDRNGVRVPNRPYTDSPSELTQSVGHQRLSTVPPGCPQLPPIDLGRNITDPPVEETTHSPSASGSSSRSTSAVSGRASTQNAWSSRRSSVPSGTAYTSVASGSQSLRRFSETVWDPGRSLKAIKPETLESVIQYLLVHSAGRLRPVSR